MSDNLSSKTYFTENNFKLDICTIIKNSQFTEKMVCDETGNHEIKVKLSSIRLSNENPENLMVSVFLIEKGNTIVHSPILATKTKPKIDERHKSLESYFTFLNDGIYIAVFKICIKKATKDIRFFVTANNCESARSNTFSVFSMKKK